MSNSRPKKFVRNRDIKLKDKEIRYERKIQQVMCEGICFHCQDKVKWKFRYDKYRPLTKPGKCQLCQKFNITKAYRTYCDICAKEKDVCPSCCEDFEYLNALKAKLDADKLKESQLNNKDINDEDMNDVNQDPNMNEEENGSIDTDDDIDIDDNEEVVKSG